MKQIVFLALALGSRLLSGAPVVKCSSLTSVSFGSDVKIDSARLEAATAATPEHCDVRGTIWPEDQFSVKLPTAWNNRFYMVGNGGTAGTISFSAMDQGLRNGYAAASTDTGHDMAKEPLASFGRRTADNPNAERKVIDFGYLAVHETAVLAKKIVKAYYGEAPRYSYWVGCSTGGRQGMSEAQRYPEDFDGLVIGAPGLDGTGGNMRRIWNAVAQDGPGAVAVAKLPLLASAVYESVLERLGEKETKDFYRLFLIPGMFHCGGGGCGTVDWLTPLVDWVEKGIAPAKLIGAKVENGETKRTRPLCPYPEVARYKGTGSIDDAANFSCAAPPRLRSAN